MFSKRRIAMCFFALSITIGTAAACWSATPPPQPQSGKMNKLPSDVKPGVGDVKPGVGEFPKNLLTQSQRNRVVKEITVKEITVKKGAKISRELSHASVYYRATLDQVIPHMAAIVLATPTQDFLQRTHKNAYQTGYSILDTTQHLTRSWSEGDLRIDQVLSSNGANLQPGQMIRFAEPVGIYQDDDSGVYYKRVIENCFELQSGSQYVLFLLPQGYGQQGSQPVVAPPLQAPNANLGNQRSQLANSSPQPVTLQAPQVAYEVGNLLLGHFNADGTDPLDEIGGGIAADGTKSLKQRLRDELTARYGIQFNFLPQVNITDVHYAQIAFAPRPDGGPVPDGVEYNAVALVVNQPQPAGAVISVERQAADGTWSVVGTFPVAANAQTGMGSVVQQVQIPGPPKIPLGTNLRVRATSGGHTSNYSQPFVTTHY